MSFDLVSRTQYLRLQLRVSFDFDQHVGVDQGADFNHGGGRHDVAKELAVCAPVLLPARNVGHEHSSAHYVSQFGIESFQSALNVPEALFRLFVSVAGANNLAVLAQRRRPGNVDSIADFDRARITYDRFPLRTG